jgi:type I restriction enzyme M protein
MNHAKHNQLVSFIWSIADDVLRDVYVRGKYRDVILPMTVIRRLDVLLEPTKAQVLKMNAFLDEQAIDNRAPQLRKQSGYVFYNTSKFTLRGLLDYPSHIRTNFEVYLDGFSPNVQEIIAKFKLRNQIDTLEEANILFALIDAFTDPHIHLGPDPVLDDDGAVVHEGLDNLGMGYVFEELVRKFNEENNEEAGEHFTPRDIIKLMAHLVFEPVRERVQEATYLLYDPACGSGGMLTEAERFVHVGDDDDAPIAPHARLKLYGQEVNPETYAICTSDMLIKGKDPGRIKYGSTLADDQHPKLKFDFMFSNPPYGKSWKNDKKTIEPRRGDIRDMRFEETGWPAPLGGTETLQFTTRTNDGQLLFLVTMLRKMKDTPLGSRIATVHNGSALFTGDAGQGMSEIRRWILENDWLEAIVALPTGMFYNTGIATYLWILSNRKAPHRQGKVQLLDATDLYAERRRNLGDKSRDLRPEHVRQITRAFLDFEETARSKIFDTTAFGYYNIIVERPERRLAQVSDDRAAAFVEAHPDLAPLVPLLRATFGTEVHRDVNAFRRAFKRALREQQVKTYKKDRTAVYDHFTWIDPAGAPVRTASTLDAPTEAEAAYVPDTDLRDRDERVPMVKGEDARTTIARYVEDEVRPYVPDAWIDWSDVRTGYEINFTRHFYTYEPADSLDDLRHRLRELERTSDRLLTDLLDA